MRLAVNGKQREVEGAPTIRAFLELNEINPQLVAVEHNGEIIRRERLAEVVLHEGDTLEIIHVVGGGC